MFAGILVEKSRSTLYLKDNRHTPLSSTERNDATDLSYSGSLRNRMSHYTIDQWVDFSRGLVAAPEGARMRAHLSTGCQECNHLSDFTTRLSLACLMSATPQVPDSTLRLARAIFRVQGRPRRGSRIPIEVVFDSFLVPAPAGLRATWQIGWQGLYRAGDCSVDLRIEPELKSSRAAVIGQINNHRAPEFDMSNLPVSLRAGDQIVAQTVSNRFGEFQMEYEEQAQLKLCINLTDSRVIQVPLKKLASEQTANQSRKISRKRAGEKR